MQQTRIHENSVFIATFTSIKKEELTAKPSIGPRWDRKCLANSIPMAFFFQNFKCPDQEKTNGYIFFAFVFS